MGKKCRICNIIEDEKGEYGLLDKPFYKQANYASVVSIGAFIEGWTLIFSKEHKYNLHNDYNSIEFYNYLKKHISLVRKKMKWDRKIIAFEHGANKCDSLTACGTSHAHLHIVPFDGSILSRIKKKKEWIKCKWRETEDIVGEKEYLLYSETPELGKDAEVYINIVSIPESQYFRRILAEEIGLCGEYSYKENPRVEQSMKVRKMFKE